MSLARHGEIFGDSGRRNVGKACLVLKSRETEAIRNLLGVGWLFSTFTVILHLHFVPRNHGTSKPPPRRTPEAPVSTQTSSSGNNQNCHTQHKLPFHLNLPLSPNSVSAYIMCVRKNNRWNRFACLHKLPQETCEYFSHKLEICIRDPTK
ncbi:hypothetical protein B5807_01603 [Epicoccum nigrum]|jgi:hypothetical protein|uniref:Uncharacterized protein n=1 Tax=Epicoccum nigrum TaxID=105696 RepID=A0A1Y2MEV2_EPING|nr:hypothetical protein B5807_01603 [Epicoccum nigrum]